MYTIFETEDDVSRYTAQRLLDRIQARPGAVLGLAMGSKKASIMGEFYYSAVDEALLASALKLHYNVTIVLDSAAAALLPRERGRALAPGMNRESS